MANLASWALGLFGVQVASPRTGSMPSMILQRKYAIQVMQEDCEHKDVLNAKPRRREDWEAPIRRPKESGSTMFITAVLEIISHGGGNR